MYKKGDLIHYKYNSFESILEITDKIEDKRYKIMDCACNDPTVIGMAIYTTKIGQWTKIKARDLALYTHWKSISPRFWELLEGTGTS
jgi:hypothetical protein